MEESTITGSPKAKEGFSSTLQKPIYQALLLSQQKKLFFRGSHFSLFLAFDDIISKPLEPKNKVGDGTRVVLLASSGDGGAVAATAQGDSGEMGFRHGDCDGVSHTSSSYYIQQYLNKSRYPLRQN
ncbi:Uncharacterized protein Fot_27244 [Forsythia ovata]|uniref:Uncharacterized protein n=1 Tax=Forsythia ovata TaxID=205694 RepID=A0ABD1UE49_9LAMI